MRYRGKSIHQQMPCSNVNLLLRLMLSCRVFDTRDEAAKLVANRPTRDGRANHSPQTRLCLNGGHDGVNMTTINRGVTSDSTVASSQMCDGVRKRAIAWLADPYRYRHVHMDIHIDIT